MLLLDAVYRGGAALQAKGLKPLALLACFPTQLLLAAVASAVKMGTCALMLHFVYLHDQSATGPVHAI
jgi:hypothetical protein